MEEKQCVVFWGTPIRSRAFDPRVFQTSDLEDGDWYDEARCSVFLSAMMCGQAVGGGLPHVGIAEPIPWREAQRALRDWRPVGRVRDLSASVLPGRVVCVLRDGKAAILHVAARSGRNLRALAGDLGVAIDEV
jgi:hypothetical protein